MPLIKLYAISMYDHPTYTTLIMETELVERQQAYVERVQLGAMLTSALLSITLTGATLWNLPMPRTTHLVLGLVLLINGGILSWTIRRLKR